MSQLTSIIAAETALAQDWAGAVRLTFYQGEEIYAQGEDADLIYRIVKGAVRTAHLQADGRRQVGDFYYEGDVIGVEVGEGHPFSAEALTDCEVLALRHFEQLGNSQVAEILDLTPTAASNRYLRAAARLSEIMQRLESKTGHVT